MPPPLLCVGISGGSGSGKSTLATSLVQAVGARHALVMEQDHYYQDLSFHGGLLAEAVNFDHPDAVDLELLASHLGTLRQGRPIGRPTYHFPTHTRRPHTVIEEPRPLLIVEGLFTLYHPGVRELLDLRIYVECEADVRLLRRLKRDLIERGRSSTSVLEQYESTVRPSHMDFVEPSKRFAHLIVRGDEPAPPSGFPWIVEEVRRRLDASPASPSS